MITFKEYCKNLKEDWGKTSPIPKETYKPVDWKSNFKWVDLGLPSGTLWADENIYNSDNPHGFWSWDDIMRSPYREYVPNREQMLELVDNCWWEWDDKKRGGIFVSKDDKNNILLPAEGIQTNSTLVWYGDVAGFYWSSSIRDNGTGFHLEFDENRAITDRSGSRERMMSVRLVKKK